MCPRHDMPCQHADTNVITVSQKLSNHRLARQLFACHKDFSAGPRTIVTLGFQLVVDDRDPIGLD